MSDPKFVNTERAKTAWSACSLHQNIQNHGVGQYADLRVPVWDTDKERVRESVTDLVANICHLCGLFGMEPSSIFTTAVEHYKEEVEEAVLGRELTLEWISGPGPKEWAAPIANLPISVSIVHRTETPFGWYLYSISLGVGRMLPLPPSATLQRAMHEAEIHISQILAQVAHKVGGPADE